MADTLSWIEIQSFAPGIVDEFASPSAYTPSPFGSAKRAVGCMALPNGSLVPGWKIVEQVSKTPHNDHWGTSYRPADIPNQVVVDTAMLSPAHRFDVTSYGPVPVEAGDVVDTDSSMDAPDHLLLAYGEAYNSAGTGATATKWYPTVYTFTGWLGSLQLPLPATQTDLSQPGGYGDPVGGLGQVVDWLTYVATQHNRIGGSLAVGRCGSYVWHYGTPANNALGTSNPDAWNVVVHWAPAGRRSPRVEWQSFPQNGRHAGSPGTMSTHVMGTDERGQDPNTWGMAWEQTNTTVYHSNRLVWAALRANEDVLYGQKVSDNTTDVAAFLWTPGIKYTPRGAGCFYWSEFSSDWTGTGFPTSDANAFGSFTDIIFGDEADQIAWMCSMNGNTLMVMMVGAGAYILKGDLEAIAVNRLAGAPGCYRPYSKPTQVGSNVAWAARNGVYMMNESGDVQPLSQNLRGDFWIPADRDDWLLTYTANGKINHRDPWIAVPNDYIYDKRSSSWWQLPRGVDPRTVTSVPFSHYEVGATGYVYAVPSYRNNTNHLTYVTYDPSQQLDQASDIYYWESNPIHDFDSTPGETIDLRTVELVASGHGSIQVQVKGMVTSTPNASLYAKFTVDSDYPIKLNADLAYRSAVDPSAQTAMGAGTPGSSQISVSITCFGATNGSTLPSIHPGFRLGYRPAQGLPPAPAVVSPL